MRNKYCCFGTDAFSHRSQHCGDVPVQRRLLQCLVSNSRNKTLVDDLLFYHPYAISLP